MPVLRIERHEKGFTCISNDTVNDERLSFRARGVLVWLLAKPDGWVVNKTAIARAGQETLHSINAAMAELHALGYLTQEAVRTDGGILAGSVVVVHEVAGPPLVPTHQDPERSGSPSLGDSAPLVSNEKSLSINYGSKRDTFAAFYATYPRHTDKEDARRAFEVALTKASTETIIEGARRYRDDPNRDDAFTKQPGTWLRHGCWDDDPLPSPIRSNGHQEGFQMGPANDNYVLER